MRFSIITPSFNQRDYLAQTAQTVLNQSPDHELTWVVVDGASTDGTIELLQSIKNPRLQWISEPDHGQSDAVNKGLQRATGDVIGWLNSDDLFTPDALSDVATAFAANPRTGWVIGRCDIIDARGKSIRPGVTRYKNRLLSRYSYRRLLRENFISQPAVFWRREFGQTAGLMDVSLHHAMDYDLWLRFGRQGDPIVLNQTLAHFRIHPQSKTGRLIRERFDEDLRVVDRYIGSDRFSRVAHRLNVEKIVWSYRAMNLFGR